jgi:Photoprotection regulator fluorescence recovery protein
MLSSFAERGFCNPFFVPREFNDSRWQIMNDESQWSKREKQAARKAFDAAYAKACHAIRARVQKMLKDEHDVRQIWRIHDYLSEQRRDTDRKYVYRYSRLLGVFALLLTEGWLDESDLRGLSSDKITKVRDLASYI